MSTYKERRNARVRLADLVEDVFGLNIRGLKSLATVIAKPRRYFTAAGDPDWYGTYTPSIRLWLTLAAFVLVLRFFLQGDLNPVMEPLGGMLATLGLVLPERPAPSLASLAMALACLSAAYLVVGALWPFWGRRIKVSLRIRYVFAALLPGTAFALVATILWAVIPALRTEMMVLAVFGLTILIDAQALFRGAFHREAWGGRLWRTLLLTIVLAATGILALGLADYQGLTALYR